MRRRPGRYAFLVRGGRRRPATQSASPVSRVSTEANTRLLQRSADGVRPHDGGLYGVARKAFGGSPRPRGWRDPPAPATPRRDSVWTSPPRGRVDWQTSSTVRQLTEGFLHQLGRGRPEQQLPSARPAVGVTIHPSSASVAAGLRGPAGSPSVTQSLSRRRRAPPASRCLAAIGARAPRDRRGARSRGRTTSSRTTPRLAAPRSQVLDPGLGSIIGFGRPLLLPPRRGRSRRGAAGPGAPTPVRIGV